MNRPMFSPPTGGATTQPARASGLLARPAVSLLAQLSQLREQAALLEAVALLVAEGTTRATASEIAQRANDESGLEINASVVGQRLRELGLTAAAAHGRSRFRLDEPRLLEAIRREVEARLVEAEAQAGASLTRHSETAQRVTQLEQRLRDARALPAREQALRQELKALEDQAQGVAQLERRAAALRQQLAQEQKLAEAVEALQQRVNALADLTQRKAALHTALDEHRQEAQALSQQEEALKPQLAQLAQRRSLLDLAQTEAALAQARAELDALNEQLGEKRSRLARLFGRS